MCGRVCGQSVVKPKGEVLAQGGPTSSGRTVVAGRGCSSRHEQYLHEVHVTSECDAAHFASRVLEQEPGPCTAKKVDTYFMPINACFIQRCSSEAIDLIHSAPEGGFTGE